MNIRQFKKNISLNKVAFDLDETRICYYIIENIRPHTRVDFLNQIISDAITKRDKTEAIMSLFKSAWKLI